MTILFIRHRDREMQNRDIIEIIVFCDFLFLLINLFFLCGNNVEKFFYFRK